MKALSLLAAGLFSSTALAATISKDATCGGSKGQTCLNSAFGNCCSSSGWCGSTTAYCGTGCQAGFGNCGTNNGAASSTASSSKTTPTPTPTPSPNSAAECLKGKNVPYKVASDAAYAQLAQPYNLRLPYKPAVIVLPTTERHVQDAVVCAGKVGVKVQAKSGGHSYASFSSGGRDGSMVIDLESFQTIALDKTSGVVKVGGGVRLGNLADGIWTQGQRALSHGTCPGVGIGGHATHGGYSHTSRSWGLAMDAIVALDVVLANGTFVHATASSSPSLYWGLRGAADSLGIITTFHMQTRAAPTSVTYFAIPYPSTFASASTFTSSFLRLQDLALNASLIDSRISFGVYLDNYGTFSLSGAFFGTPSEFTSRLQPEFLRGMPAPGDVVVKPYSWHDYLILVSGKSSIKEPLTGYAEHDTFFAKSLTVPESSGLSAAALDAFYAHARTASAQGVEFYSIVNLYGGPGSRINARDADFAAYRDRDSLWVFQNYGQGGDAKTVAFVEGLQDAVVAAQPETHFGAYLNYVDPSYGREEAHRVYYGEEVYGRLVRVKGEVDPGEVFWNPQSVGA